jgi:hypothetical protein
VMAGRQKVKSGSEKSGSDGMDLRPEAVSR